MIYTELKREIENFILYNYYPKPKQKRCCVESDGVLNIKHNPVFKSSETFTIFRERNDDFASLLNKYQENRKISDKKLMKLVGLDTEDLEKIKKGKRPSKTISVMLAIALKLNEVEFEDLLNMADYELSYSLKKDVIVRYFIRNKQYDVPLIGEAIKL
ncbi:MAG: hypothetical protein Q4B60_06345 [Erysipelotrichaceae bacterium]|nr:hypothetical protein [Erysipelotrichaceae bacterium]